MCGTVIGFVAVGLALLAIRLPQFIGKVMGQETDSYRLTSILGVKVPKAWVDTAVLGALLATIYACTAIAQRTIGATWSDNMNCLLGIVVAGVITGLFVLIRRAFFGPRSNG